MTKKLFPEDNPEIVELYKIIKKLGSISQESYATYLKRRDVGIWEFEDIKQWAEAFYNDPWRIEHKQYRSVGHFLRDPERYADKVTKKEEAWTL